jgi:hypothetical protein
MVMQGLLLEGEDTDTLYSFRIPACTGFFLVRQEIAFGKHTTKPTHTQNLRLKYLLMTKLQPIEAHYIHCYKMPPSRPTLVQEHKHFG